MTKGPEIPGLFRFCQSGFLSDLGVLCVLGLIHSNLKTLSPQRTAAEATETYLQPRPDEPVTASAPSIAIRHLFCRISPTSGPAGIGI
jgi:hypothetical protein